jgi:hypothetical protein
MNPTLCTPDGKRLGCIDMEQIQFCFVMIRAQFCAREPIGWKFRSAVGHVFSTEYAEGQHLLWR